VPEAPEWCGELRPAKLLRLRQEISGEVTEAMLRQVLEASRLEELDDEDGDDADRSGILGLLSAPLNNPLAAKFARMLGMGGSPTSGQDGSGNEAAMRGNRQGRGLAGATQVTATASTIPALPDALPSGYRYPEWSADRQAYRPRWCTVAEFEPPVTAETEPLEVEPDLWLRKHLAQLGQADETHRRQSDGDVLDITSLIEFAVDRRSDRTGDTRIYEQRRATGHDLGVLILLDASGSTGESTAGQQIFTGERQLAARLTAELEALGNRVATYGFYSRGKDNVRFLRAKGFDEPYGYAARRRLAAIEPSGFTRMGAAVRHATHVLRHQAGTGKLLLIVIGDGLPYEDGYEHRQAYEDTRRALTEAVSTGVGCACVAMRSPTRPDVIERVWGHVAHCHLDDPQQLAGEVRPLLRRALKDAAAQRRNLSAIPEAA
jgi:nitric oxide reductase NorD protein